MTHHYLGFQTVGRNPDICMPKTSANLFSVVAPQVLSTLVLVVQQAPVHLVVVVLVCVLIVFLALVLLLCFSVRC